MTTRLRGQLRTAEGELAGTVEVSEHSGLYSGSIDLSRTPSRILELFRDYEELVNGQVLSLLDDADARLNALGISFHTDDQEPLRIHDLQVYPSDGAVSFRPPGS
ncbi:hypothetical protein BO221_07960 [Archangium sp. Cb G35]|uniref:hypothetical protein n=1 Tax=Archangium sp. Cb G35 TaxID=1920190 RepID=UPI000936CB26|nr:hypothetical protein [Archangium sp. Cb G35]OJT25778.1 hypothetical protein BO221_07960 [Archangium sp. Cb G35]